jgi:tight adherence protein C
MMFLLIVGIAAGGAIALWGLVSVRQVEGTLTTRLQRFELRPASSLTELELQLPRSERIMGPLRRMIAMRVRQFTPVGTVEKVQANLAMAGNPNNITVQDFLGIKGMVAIAGGIAMFLFLTFIFHVDTVKFVVLLGVGIVGGFFAPDLWLRQIIKRRQHEIQNFLADAIDILAISVEAGQGFIGALATLSSRKQNALTSEFDRFRTEVAAGKGRRDAFRDLALRTGVEDLTNFVAAMIQADQLGIGIAEVLRAQSEELRIKRRQRAEEKARKAPIKMLFPLIFLMFPALFIVILGPAVPKLMFFHG